MDFFAQQDKARRQTRSLIFLFLLAVIAIVAAVDMLVLTVVANLGADHGQTAAPGLPRAGDNVGLLALTSLATLLCPLVIAIWLPLLADTRMEVPVGPMVWNAIWMVVLPVVAGIALRSYRPRMPRGWDAVATSIASVAIVLIILVVVAANRERLAQLGPTLALGMLVLNLGAYGLAFGGATALRWPHAQRRTLVIEVGMQNAGLGSVLALAHLGEAGAVPSAFYTALCVVTSAAALPFRRNRNRALPTSQSRIPSNPSSAHPSAPSSADRRSL